MPILHEFRERVLKQNIALADADVVLSTIHTAKGRAPSSASCLNIGFVSFGPNVVRVQ